MLVSEARCRYALTICLRIKIKLVWIPFCISLREHEQDDTLAKLALDQQAVKHITQLSNMSLKTTIRYNIVDVYEASMSVDRH